MRPDGKHLDRYRKQSPGYTSPDGALYGGFRVKELTILSSGVDEHHGWEHVSVSLPHRCPTWEEMVRIKNLFWREDEAVMQLHPPKSDYVNFHPYTLHLWRPLRADIPDPGGTERMGMSTGSWDFPWFFPFPWV